MTSYQEELQAWKDFELDCLIEEQEKPIQIVNWEDDESFASLEEIWVDYKYYD